MHSNYSLDVIGFAEDHTMFCETGVTNFSQVHVAAAALQTLSVPETIQRL